MNEPFRDLFLRLGSIGSKQKLILFPYLGGTVSCLRGLAEAITQRLKLEVWLANPPGHMGSRLAPLDTMEQLIAAYHQAISGSIDQNTYLFGHSMGGMVAYHLTRYWHEHNLPMPGGLMLSACGPGKTLDRAIYSDYSETALIDHLMKFEAIPSSFRTDDYLRQLFMPSFRSDYRILESIMDDVPMVKLSLPTSLICGASDRQTSLADSLQWVDHFEQSLDLRLIHGSHMFVHHQEPAVADVIVSLITGEPRKEVA